VTSYRDKKIVVVGAGVSGLALCRLLAERAAHVTLSDRQSADSIAGLDQLDGLPVTYDFGQHTLELFTGADLIVMSPGVPTTIPAVQAAAKQGVQIIGEVELAAREIEAPIIGITGTNGKSTTTALLGEILNACGKKTFVGGNIGEPLTNAISERNLEWLVVELSSFQLETINKFHPRYAMLLNISADHLDRYAGMTEYIAAKQRLFENMTQSDRLILNADDPAVVEAVKGISASKIWFSTAQILPEGMFLQAGKIVWRWQGEEERFPVDQLLIKGLHNIENVMAAMIPALCEKCSPQQVWQAVCRFKGLPHRMELIRKDAGVEWFNDSKGTNIGSVVMSLGGLSAPVTLIAGGKDKGGDFGLLAAEVGRKVAHLILIGEAASRMEQALAGSTNIIRAESLENAVEIARDLTPAGGVVLLSPGCSSFDMFASYIERGETFTRLVTALKIKDAV
jgi:UDP-N-acetylmuramoylalanine--D-glutamate ligase